MGRSSAAGSDMVVEPATLMKKQNRCFGQASPIGVAMTGWQYRRPRLTVRVDRWFQMRGWVGPRAIHNYLYVSEQPNICAFGKSATKRYKMCQT